MATLVLTHITSQIDTPVMRSRILREMAPVFGGDIVWGEDLMDVPVRQGRASGASTEEAGRNAPMNDILNAGPAPVETPQCWRGPDMARRPELWMHELAPEEVAEIEAAAARLDGVPILEIVRDPLPKLAKRLGRIPRGGIARHRLSGDPGPAGRALDGRAVGGGLLGSSACILGEAVSQNGKGHVLGPCPRPRPRLRAAGDARLPDQCAPALPHRRIGPRLPALPQDGA